MDGPEIIGARGVGLTRRPDLLVYVRVSVCVRH